jgi:hypothetical protein
MFPSEPPQKQPHEHYSDHQIQQARETDIIDFLQRTEGFTFKKEGRTWKRVDPNSRH